MNLKLSSGDWDHPQLLISGSQKDYNFRDHDDLLVFIYGYPFDPKKGRWFSEEYVRSRYLENDLNFVNEIDGVYTILIVDTVGKKSLIITDRYGIYNLFYHQEEDMVIISDKIAEIVPHVHDVKLNEQSIIEYLYFGFKLGNKTHIEGVNEFEGASIYEIDSEINMTKNVYWNLVVNGKKGKIDNERFRTVFNMHIGTAFKLEKNVSIPLSGGLDTRTILSAAIWENQDFKSYTYGLKTAPDVKIAKKISKHLDLNHTLFEIDEEWIMNIPNAFEKGASDYNGLIPPYSAINQRSFEEYAKDKLILMGVLGNEIWRGLLAEKNMESISKEVLLDTIMRLFQRNKSRLLKGICGLSDKEVMNRIRRSLEYEMFSPESKEKPLDQFEVFVLKNWGSNWAGNAFKAAGKYSKVYSAFLNPDLLPQVVLQDRNHRTNGAIQKYIITKNNPYLATVKLDTSDIRHGASVTNDIGSKVKHLQTVIPHYSRAAVNYFPKRLFKRQILKAPFFTDYPNWIRDHHGNFILKVLDHDKMYSRNLIQKEMLEEMIRLFLKGDDSQEQIITRLLGLELWLSEIYGCSKMASLTSSPSGSPAAMGSQKTVTK